jgi:hypothetical protein
MAWGSKALARSAGILAISLAPLAFANSTLIVTDTVTATGTNTNYAANTYAGYGPNGTIVPTNTFNLGNSFNGTNPTTGNPYPSTGLDFGLSTGGVNTWNFQDDYNFSTTGATVQGVTIGLPTYGNTGLTNLQARIIYQAGNPAPTVGTPAAGTVVDSWQSVSGPLGFYNIIMPTGIAGGDYVLQIRGEAAAGGGSYAGTLSFNAPVPLPAALPLLFSGLAGLGLIGRRRKAHYV